MGDIWSADDIILMFVGLFICLGVAAVLGGLAFLTWSLL